MNATDQELVDTHVDGNETIGVPKNTLGFVFRMTMSSACGAIGGTIS